jgi:hypothetical protein
VSIHELGLRVVPGAGLVGRFGSLVLVIRESRTSAEAADLVGIAEGLADHELPGRLVANRATQAMISMDPDRIPTFCLMADADEGLAVMLHGPIRLTAGGPKGDIVLSGEDRPTWVDKFLTAEIDHMAIGPEGEPADADDSWPVDLIAGTVPGGAALFEKRTGAPVSPVSSDRSSSDGGPAPEAERSESDESSVPPPVEDAGEAATSGESEVVAGGPEAGSDDSPAGSPPDPAAPADEPAPPDQPDSAAPPVPPEPTTPPDQATPAAPAVPPESPDQPDPSLVGGAPPDDEGADAGEQVLGIRCREGHFNHPDAEHCVMCGAAMVQSTVILAHGPRPPLGQLVFDDGSIYTVDRSYVIGRRPENDPAVIDGTAHSLPRRDPDLTLSRVHAELRLSEWDVQLVDRGSENGSLFQQGADPWQRAEPDTPVALQAGACVRLAGHSFVFESHHEASSQ